MEKGTITLITIMSSVVSIVTMSVGLLLFADGRYASATDLEELRMDQHTAFVDMRVRSIEDELFDLQSVPNSARTPLDRAKVERYLRELRELQSNN
jgi:hypothetical protein